MRAKSPKAVQGLHLLSWLFMYIRNYIHVYIHVHTMETAQGKGLDSSHSVWSVISHVWYTCTLQVQVQCRSYYMSHTYHINFSDVCLCTLCMYMYMYIRIMLYMTMYMYMYMKKSSMQCQKKEGVNPGQLFWAFGPHQQGATQSLPGMAGLN